MNRGKKIVFVIIALGIVIRLLHWVLPFMDSDMAVTGLMARYILRGEFPVFFWGQNYCGAIEAYLTAPVFAVFGVSRYTLNIVPVCESIVFMLLMYILARRAFGEKVGILTLLFTAIPARYLVVNTVLPRANYVENLIFGAIVFYLTYRIVYPVRNNLLTPDDASSAHISNGVYEEKGVNSGRLFFGLGLTYGLAWWTNFQSIYFILTSFFFIFLRKKLIFFTRRFLNLVLGIAVGGSPFWYYCFRNDFSPFKSIGEEKFTNIATGLKNFFVVGLPVIFGVIKSNRGIYIPIISHLLLIIYVAAFVFILKDRFKGLFHLGKLSLKKSNGMELFIVFFIVFALIYTFSGYALVNTRRYMLILYLSLPVYLAYFIAELSGKHKKLSIFITGIVLIANVQQNIVSVDLFNKDKRKEFFEEKRNKKELFTFLEKEGIKYVYVNDYWRSYNHTFDVQERIIFTEWNPSRYPAYFEGAKQTKDVAFCFPENETVFGQILRNIGAKSYKRKNIAGVTLFYDFKPLEKDYQEIDLSKVQAVSNYNQDEANYALDGNPMTRWTTKLAQAPGMYFGLDLGKAKQICRIVLELGDSPYDYPRGYSLSTSLDGEKWQNIIVSNANWAALHRGKFHPVMTEKNAKFEICFKPRLVRFVKLEQTGRHNAYWWSIYEIELFGQKGYLKRDKVNVKSGDLNLAGYTYRPIELDSHSPIPIIILSHGSNPDGQQKFFYRELAERFARRKYLVFTFDYRGFGESDDPSDITKAESFNWKQDLASAIGYIRGEYRVRELILMGHSFGAALTLAVAAEQDSSILADKSKADKIVLISPPRRMNELFFKKNPLLGLEWLQKTMEEDMKLKALPPKKILEEIHRPIILESFKGRHFAIPVLFVDEGNAPKKDLQFLTDFCSSIDGDITRITIPDTEHYYAAENTLQREEAIKELVKVVDDWIKRGLSEKE
ncbi:MAG: alpha/beta fold hydrolase [Candidatus Ratteibacteria bacterium]|nr:alpha/beta fold hydrolase [Candidatus Ratteibacteria bacterium]